MNDWIEWAAYVNELPEQSHYWHELTDLMIDNINARHCFVARVKIKVNKVIG